MIGPIFVLKVSTEIYKIVRFEPENVTEKKLHTTNFHFWHVLKSSLVDSKENADLEKCYIEKGLI